MKIFSIGKRTDRNGEQNTEKDDRPLSLSDAAVCKTIWRQIKI